MAPLPTESARYGVVEFPAVWDWPGGSEIGCQKKFLDISRECPGEFKNSSIFFGGAQEINRITEANESDI